MGSTWRAVLHPAMLECVNTFQSLDIQSPGRWQGERGILWTKAQKDPWCPAFTRTELIFFLVVNTFPTNCKGLDGAEGEWP